MVNLLKASAGFLGTPGPGHPEEEGNPTSMTLVFNDDADDARTFPTGARTYQRSSSDDVEFSYRHRLAAGTTVSGGQVLQNDTGFYSWTDTNPLSWPAPLTASFRGLLSNYQVIYICNVHADHTTAGLFIGENSHTGFQHFGNRRPAAMPVNVSLAVFLTHAGSSLSAPASDLNLFRAFFNRVDFQVANTGVGEHVISVRDWSAPFARVNPVRASGFYKAGNTPYYGLRIRGEARDEDPGFIAGGRAYHSSHAEGVLATVLSFRETIDGNRLLDRLNPWRLVLSRAE